MEPLITSSAEAQRFVQEALMVSEPFARGDLPCNFTYDEITEAHAKAATAMHYLTGRIEAGTHEIVYSDYECLSQSHQALRTLTRVLQQHDNTDPRSAAHLERSEQARISLWPVFARVKIVYLDGHGNAIDESFMPS